MLLFEDVVVFAVVPAVVVGPGEMLLLLLLLR